MQRNVGPGALLRLIGGALRLDPDAFRRAVSPSDASATRLHVAIVVLAAVSTGFAYAMEGAGDGAVNEGDFALYRLLVVAGAAETIVQFLLFTSIVYLLRRVTRRPTVPFATLVRLLALALAPACLLVLVPLLGIPDWADGVIAIWRIVASMVALRVGLESSWLGALLTVVAADLMSAPLVSLVLFGVARHPAPVLPA